MGPLHSLLVPLTETVAGEEPTPRGLIGLSGHPIFLTGVVLGLQIDGVHDAVVVLCLLEGQAGATAAKEQKEESQNVAAGNVFVTASEGRCSADDEGGEFVGVGEDGELSLLLWSSVHGGGDWNEEMNSTIGGAPPSAMVGDQRPVVQCMYCTVGAIVQCRMRHPERHVPCQSDLVRVWSCGVL